MGFVKMVNEIDAREAANQGMVIRPLTQANIQKHLESVGLESEFATHSRMRGLSGGAGGFSDCRQPSPAAASPGVLSAESAISAACCLSCVAVVLPACLHSKRLRLLGNLHCLQSHAAGGHSCLSHVCWSRPPAWQAFSPSARHVLLQPAGLASLRTTLHIMLPWPVAGGQRMKCVMGAATWNNPHIIVLDEPSNFLDRDSLGALTAALKGFGGGVLIISHNKGECWHL